MYVCAILPLPDCVNPLKCFCDVIILKLLMLPLLMIHVVFFGNTVTVWSFPLPSYID